MSNEFGPEQELATFTKAWAHAIISNDAEAIGRFASDDWVLVGGTGVFEQGPFLSAVAAGELTHETFEVDVARVRTYGDTAVVTSRVTNNGTYNGDPFSADEWTTDVFLKQQGEWRCVLSHLTPVTDS
ncbi:MAG: DUF4440 domain-containing protein [Chloroflexi bacterium]|nr:DUF4440 domain-containing protein [Chloroflexota bacterium]